MSEGPQAYVHDKPKARKAHRCYECHGTIQPGENYHHHHGIWDNEGRDFRVCNDCNKLIDEIDDSANFGELYEHIFEDENCEWMKRFIDTMRKRGAEVKDWMEERLLEITEEKLLKL